VSRGPRAVTETYEPFASAVRVIKRGRRRLVFDSAGESKPGVRLGAAPEAERLPPVCSDRAPRRRRGRASPAAATSHGDGPRDNLR
jgi:hypothetical protein